MTWFKVDDTLAFHHKTVEAGNSAMGLWVRAGAWSAQNLTDGFIPRAIARQMGTKSQISKLLTAHLWTERSDGFSFHEWVERQPTKQDVEADRQANRKRQAEHRKRKREARDSKPADDNETPGHNGVTHTAHNGVTHESRNAVTNRTHARADPDPTRPIKNNHSPSAAPIRSDTRATPNEQHAATTFADGTPIPTEPDQPPTTGALALVPDPPAEIESSGRPTPIQPSNSAQTLVRTTVPGLPRSITTKLATEVQRLVNDRNVDNQLISPALQEWARRPGLGPAMLPHLLTDLTRAQRTGPKLSTADQRVLAAQSLKRPEWDHNETDPRELT